MIRTFLQFFIKLFFNEKTLGIPRSPKWDSLRKSFLYNRVCEVCGGIYKLEAHHIKPFHSNPELELDIKNLIPLCEGNPNMNCHLMFGHLGSFLSINSRVIDDCNLWQNKIKTRP